MIVIEVGYCKGCGICIRMCPKHILDFADNLNSLGYRTPYVTDAEECSDCCQCELFCPDFAISIRKDGTKKGDG